jgi:hypothetical protein
LVDAPKLPYGQANAKKIQNGAYSIFLMFTILWIFQVQAELDDHLGKRKTVSLGKLFFSDPERLTKNVFVIILFCYEISVSQINSHDVF